MLRCVYESLALKYRIAMDNLEALTGRQLDRDELLGL